MSHVNQKLLEKVQLNGAMGVRLVLTGLPSGGLPLPLLMMTTGSYSSECLRMLGILLCFLLHLGKSLLLFLLPV